MDLRYPAFSMTIELWGWPGAGKTTVREALELRGRVQAPTLKSYLRNPIDPFPWYSSTSIRKAVLLRESLGDAHSKSRDAAVAAALRQLDAEKSFGRPLVLEEGVVHEVWRQMLADPDLIGQRWWRRAIDLVPHRVFILDVQPAEARARIATKQNVGPINKAMRDSELTDDIWRRGILAYEAIKRFLTTKTRRSVTGIDSWSATTDEIAEKIERLAV